MNDAARVADLLDVVRLLRESSGPGVVASEKAALECLVWLASECARCVVEENEERASQAADAVPDVAQDVDPAVAVLALLVAFARETFLFRLALSGFHKRPNTSNFAS